MLNKDFPGPDLPNCAAGEIQDGEAAPRGSRSEILAGVTQPEGCASFAGFNFLSAQIVLVPKRWD